MKDNKNTFDVFNKKYIPAVNNFIENFYKNRKT